MDRWGRAALGVGIIFAINAAAYIWPVLLPGLPYANIVLLALYAALFANFLWALIPLYLFTPLPLHVPGPIYALTVCAAIVWMVINHKPRRPVITMALAMTVLSALIAAIGTVRSQDLGLATRYFEPYLKAVPVVVLFAMLVKEEAVRIGSLKLLAAVSAAAVVFKLAYAARPEVYESILAVDAELLRGKVDIYFAGEFVRRLTLIGQDPNYASAVQLVGLSASIILAFRSGKAGWIWHVCVIMNLVQIAGTFSRSGLIAAIIILALSFRLTLKHILAMATVVATVVAYVANNPALLARASSVIGDQTGGTHRTTLWANAADMWGDAPLFGSGLSNYTYKFGDAAHSTYLQVLAEQGLLGLAILMLWMYALMRPPQAGGVFIRTEGRAAAVGFILMLQTISFFDVDILALCLLYIGFMCATDRPELRHG